MKKQYNSSKISSKLKKLRLAKDLSRDELARQAKVNYNTIIKLESGSNKNPTVVTLIGLAKALDVGIEDFLT